MKSIGRVVPGLLPGLLLASWLGAGCATSSTPAGEREMLGSVATDVIDSRFGVVVPTDQGQQLLVTRFVLLVPGTTFGWGIRLAGPDRTVSWREVYTLPSPPGELGGAHQEEPKKVQREGRDELEDGWLSKYWTLDAGDPIGRHVIDVYVDGQHAYTFEFDVVPPPPRRAPAARRGGAE